MSVWEDLTADSVPLDVAEDVGGAANPHRHASTDELFACPACRDFLDSLAPNTPTIVRDTATVTVKGCVDGRKRRRTRTERRGRSTPVQTLTVDPRVMVRAHEVCRPGEHIVIDDAEHVHTEYDAAPRSPFAQP